MILLFSLLFLGEGGVLPCPLGMPIRAMSMSILMRMTMMVLKVTIVCLWEDASLVNDTGLRVMLVKVSVLPVIRPIQRRAYHVGGFRDIIKEVGD